MTLTPPKFAVLEKKLPDLTLPQVYRVVAECLAPPRRTLTQLFAWVVRTQRANRAARLSHLRRRAGTGEAQARTSADHSLAPPRAPPLHANVCK